MKARSFFAEKVFYLFLLAVLTLCICFPVFASSNTTILTTKVPAHIDIDVTIDGGGTVEINGRKLSETSIVPVERNQAVSIKITPDDGYNLRCVTFDGKDITNQVANGSLTLPQLDHETSVCFKFVASIKDPATEDNRYPFWIFCGFTAAVPLLGIIILLTASRKKIRHT